MGSRPTTVQPGDISRLRPWVMAVAHAAAHGVDVEDPFRLAAIGFRETEWGWARGYTPKGSPVGHGDDPDGDGPVVGYGFGFFQIDRRFHAAFLAEEEAKTVAGQLWYVCRILHNYRQFIRQVEKNPVALEHATFAAYNAGPRRVMLAIKNGRDPDEVTTGGDYAHWVIAKADSLRLSAPSVFTHDS